MQTENQPIPSPPIIEAVVDIDCDLPPNLNLDTLRVAAETALLKKYPKFKQQLIQEHILTKEGNAPPEMRVNQVQGAMQFLSEDEKQLVQFRPNGFSFNRLSPYGSFDDYLPEIEAGWQIFCQLAKPVIVRKIGIRMINRILLPLDGGKLNFSDYLTVFSRLPETGSPLGFLGFLEQQMALDNHSGNQVNIVKTTELPQGDKLPLILDIDVFYPCEISPNEWKTVRDRLDSLRSLKNRIFRNTLTPQCLNLFSPQD